jgi:hypothetical protein
VADSARHVASPRSPRACAGTLPRTARQRRRTSPGFASEDVDVECFEVGAPLRVRRLRHVFAVDAQQVIMYVTGIPRRRISIFRKATGSPGGRRHRTRRIRRRRVAATGIAENSGSSGVMSQPRRDCTRSGSPSVDTIARKSSHFTSNTHSPRVGSARSGRAWFEGAAPQVPLLAEPNAPADVLEVCAAVLPRVD